MCVFVVFNLSGVCAVWAMCVCVFVSVCLFVNVCVCLCVCVLVRVWCRVPQCSGM